MRTPRCNICRSEVRWCTTRNGKQIMLDIDTDDERGEFRLEPDGDRPTVWAIFVPAEHRDVARRAVGLYAAHRDTCRPLTVDDAVIDPIQGARAHDDNDDTAHSGHGHAAGARPRTPAPVA